MKLRTRLMILAVAAGVLCAAPASAGRLFLQVHGGWSTFNLDDVNDALNAAGEDYGEPILDTIDSGWDAGLKVGYDLTAELGLALGYARLWGSSEFTRFDYHAAFDLPADLFELSLDYVPVSDRRVRFGAGTTLGLVRSAAGLELSDVAGGPVDADFKGSGFLFGGYGIAEMQMAPRWILFGQAGLRHAVISTLKVDGEVVYNPDSVDDKLRFNYGGFFLRLGLRFHP